MFGAVFLYKQAHHFVKRSRLYAAQDAVECLDIGLPYRW